jgi:CubicO group peptidase (beta-lactamase class C family)
MLLRSVVRVLSAAAVIVVLLVGGSGGAGTSATMQGRFPEQLDEQVPGWLARYGVPGVAVAVVEHGEVAWARGYGWADAARGVRVTPDTVFQLASVSKPVAAWGVMRLVEANRLALDTPVERYLTRWHLPPSEFDASGVTVRRLLSHTAGLSIPGYLGIAPDQPLPTLEESLDGQTNVAGGDDDLAPVHLVQPPGQGVRYSGGGYTLLQLFVEEGSGQPFAAFMEAEVFRPLGMSGSSFDPSPALLAAAATGHDADGHALPPYHYTELAAAGLHSTAGSLARWVAAALPGPRGEPPGRGVLTPASLREMFAPQPATAGALPHGAWGLGYMLELAPKGPRWVWHLGSNRGWKTYFAALPDRGAGIVLLTNGDNGWEVTQAIGRAWGEALGLGPSPTDMPSH